ncbi:amino acid/amide ABC transporter substrate-binding protein (HAAT family) [Actinomadura pelletieri DSM 43383]|uniref:Amino acid/amide ABC transporter substrate-binding protein (HAAT family) n=1 Tax=Actinomadura pelletieri DSM 43383 TaxID=1120940 RepID=A0A495QUE2_9ACTN|nr:substrate-binding domain-containing protein [Actinomadura pelletieri]RKS77144.1 amino acid/amide ABC transporter substrate-binding protein (HAAT family) [Actinomadura pelletieri DSM 43383]
MDDLGVALVVPRQGPAGLFGPSAELCARLAEEEINAEDGVHGRRLRLTVVDGGAPPDRVADEVGELVVSGAVQAVTGWHVSTVRQRIVPRVAGRVPYVYTALYEGGERSPGVFLTGETPEGQLRPALGWLSSELGVRRWTIVGDDYVWPRDTARAVRSYLAELGAVLCDEIYVRLGTKDFSEPLRRIDANGCEAVLMLLVGDDAVAFNRAFGASGLPHLRFSPLMDENMLLASGVEGTRGLFSAAGFFETLPTGDGLDFGARYHRRFGPQAPPLNSMGESCYEGVRLLAELFRRSGGEPDVRAMTAASEGLGYDGPRGPVEVRDRHLRQKVFLAAADGLEFDVLYQLTP